MPGMNAMKRLNQPIKDALRRGAWIAKNLFWQNVFPVAAGIVNKAVVDNVRASVLPQTSSPFMTGHLLRVETVDGALMAGLRPQSSWAKYALPKGLPSPDSKVLAIENEPHRADDFSGEIPAGYGAGTKTLLLSDSVIVKINGRTSVQKINYHVHKTDRSGGREHYDLVVTGVEPRTKQWELNIPRGPYKGRYAFIKTDGAMICNRMKDMGLQIAKPDYTLRKEDRLTEIDPSKTIVERKIDGSLGNAHIQGQRVAFRSHREGGETYYDKLPAVEFIKNESSFATSRLLYPGPSLAGTVLQGELAHPDGAARVSGILNSLAPNARAIQVQRGPVRYFVWDVLKYRGRDVSNKPYAERRALAEEIVREIRRVNKCWDIVEKLDWPHKAYDIAMKQGVPEADFRAWAAKAYETPEQFYKRVTNEPLPWGEGVVIKPRDLATQKWDKMKMVGFGYYKLVDIIEGDGKYANNVGRLLVENPTNGARGEVGSLSVPDEFRSWMYQNRRELIGETVKVRSQEVTARGVPRAGVFYGFHNGEVDLLMSAEAGAAGTDRTPKEIMYAIKSAAGWRKK